MNVFKSVESTVRTDCHIEEQVIYRDFVVANPGKIKHCVGIHDDFIDFDLKTFLAYLPAVRSSLFRIVSMKGTLYCSLCDAHKQQYFRIADEEIVMSNEFCRNLLLEEVDYFTFMHIVYVEFLDQLLQYLACFETDAKVFRFPFPTFMAKYKRRIQFVKTCLGSTKDKKNFMKNCFMICRQFSLTKFSTFFEGDLEMMKQVNVALHSFMRKYRRGERLQVQHDDRLIAKFGVKGTPYEELERQVIVPDNIDGELLEPLGPHSMITNHKYYFSDKDRVHHLNHLNTELYTYGYNTQDAKKVKQHKEIKKKMKLDLIKATSDKLKEKIAKLMNPNAKGAAPKVKVFKLPLKHYFKGKNGFVDRLSTRYFKEHLHSGMYPQRGHHKFPDSHWQFKKHKVMYSLIGKGKKKRHKEEDKKKKKKKNTKPKKTKSKSKSKSKNRVLEGRRLSNQPRKTVELLDKNDIYIRKLNKTKADAKTKTTDKKAKKGKDKEKSDDKQKEKDLKKALKKKKPKKKVKEEKLKIDYTLNDQMSDEINHKEYRDVISRPNTHAPRKGNKEEAKADKSGVESPEQVNEIFPKSKATVKIHHFHHEYAEEGLDPLIELLHVNYRFNVTTLIERRFLLPERLSRNVVNQYLSVNQEAEKDFNTDIHELKIDDFETIDEKMRDIKELIQVRKVLMKDGASPGKLTEINSEIQSKEKAVLANEANKKLLIRMNRIKREKRKNMYSDLNLNKYPHYHHHTDAYSEDSLAGIQHHIAAFFGS